MKGSGKGEVIIMRFLRGQRWDSGGIGPTWAFLFLIIKNVYKFIDIN